MDYLGYAGRVERVYVNDNIEKNIVKALLSVLLVKLVNLCNPLFAALQRKNY